jgi:ketosteroid isomerase-like protein
VGVQANHALLARLYAAFNRRDAEGVLAFLCGDVDWPNGMEGGRVHGRDAVRAYWRRQWAAIDPRVEPIRMEEAADGATAVEVHQVIRDLSGTMLKDQVVRHTYRFRGGLVERMDIATPAAASQREA